MRVSDSSAGSLGFLLIAAAIASSRRFCKGMTVVSMKVCGGRSSKSVGMVNDERRLDAKAERDACWESSCLTVSLKSCMRSYRL